MSNFIPLPPTYAVLDPQVRAVLDVLSRNMQVVIDSGTVTTANTALTSVGGASTFGSPVSSTNVTNLAASYTLDTLTADLKRGAAEVITGALNGTTIMKLEPAGQYVVFQHRDASILGTVGAYAGTIRTGLGITSTGILGGYNRQSDGAWQTTFAIESSTGNLTLLGTLRAASIISVDAYLGSTLVSDVVSNAASVTTKLNKSAADILSGTITFTSAGGFKTGTIVVDGSGNATGAGVAITSKGIVGRTNAATTFTIDAVTGAATFKGDITGGSNISITGDASFLGQSLSTSSIVIGGFTYFLDYSAYAEALTLPTLNATRVGFYGRAASSPNVSGGRIGYNVGVVGYGQNVFGSKGIGVVGQGDQTGGYFSGTEYGVIADASGITPISLAITDGTLFRWGLYNIPSPSGTTTKFLRDDGTWQIPPGGGGTGTVTSVSGTGTVSGLTLSGTVTTSGSLTLGGALSVTQANLIASAPASTYYLSGSGWTTTSVVMSLAGTNSGTAAVASNTLNILGSTSTGIAGAYVGTAGSGNTVTLDIRTTSPSDRRLKHEIADIDLGLEFVNKLRPVSYKLKADPRQQKGYGLIADEVEDHIEDDTSLVYLEPDWKVGDETGFKTIHYPSYVAVLIKAVQELSAKVEALQAQLKG